ncbi:MULTISPECIES: 2-iminoacetate synthase ThiH [Tatumella]|uniref:2-iminoacetate synthase ThiH n=1 Tax=Tatumella punctata TaxID=399969 RepID=A0ABW1VUW8_9GAMM|nr:MULTISPECIES: 2-iminoacetate synthase ThiH [unclassified Tatumella]MBS0857450.1 2-iminoacetate synthase ThiH [Tatumella sp. JGM16]MBS0878799.1 2-iminoacetate synthase ThiH [Tatumella sp. JGM82]MBS0892262.1 2-iminoacetate synthase ThiH [Tatumella sp. JGM94]MBS0901133.1 2-iminoacetate synthase ThiH [Tatumella sp. JGM100]MBS0914142.1 2-iminoacetate synthase ThiH [Tatumella sp. JGM91]
MADFADYWQSLDQNELRLRIDSQTPAQVGRALSGEIQGTAALMALLSPAAESFLEQMAARAQQLTRQRFGHTVNFFAPLYLSNLCANECTYCGFSMGNRIRRKTLDSKEISLECQAIRKLGFNQLLLVTGEHQNKVGMEYFRSHLPGIRQQFSSLMMEVQPLQEDEYRELRGLGLDGVLVYQETYHTSCYATHHLRGNKQDFFFRLQTPERLGRAGVDRIGLGVLAGLSGHWRTDCLMMGEHLNWLQKHYWQSRYSVAFPRLRPCAGGITPASLMNERQLLQTMCAFRLFSPPTDISLSTRESPKFRDHAIPIVVTTASAFSKTAPGGYAESSGALEQFSPDDHRRPEVVAAALQKTGLQPVWKDWEPYFGRNNL